MDFKEYQDLSSKTANKMEHIMAEGRTLELLNYCLGLAGESGELIDYIKKVIFHKHELNLYHVEKELGDILWYVSQLARVLNLDMGDIAETNIEKLKKRYPNGFSTEKSVNRDDK